MALNLNALRVFVAVVEAKGFTRAATRLNLSQPAVSKAVLSLEQQLETPLLERGGRTVKLTDAGAALHERALELFAVERTAEEELRARRGLETGVLRIGASTTIATYLLPAFLGEFQSLHPGIVLEVLSANTRDVLRSLRRRRLDVALVEGPVDDRGISVEPWRRDDLALIASPDAPLIRDHGTSVSVQQLADCPFIVRERGSGTREVAESVLAAHGVTMVPTLTLDSTEAVKQAVASGLGLAVISRAAAADQLALGRVVEVQVNGLVIPRQLSVLRLIGRRVSAPAVAFEALLFAQVIV